MIDLTLEKSDLRLRDRWRWNTVARRWAAEMGATVTAAVRSAAPVGKREVGGHNGQLRESIEHRVHVGKTSARVEIYSRVPYVGYVIRGTSPHVILPRNVARLHWIEGGNHVYRTRVNHPGTKANPFPERAVRPLMGSIDSRLASAVKMSLEA